jgi:seryl-tRNA synthetase
LVKTWGEHLFEGRQNAQDHLDFAMKKNWVDFERGAKVAGAKFYYLKGDLALLENAITQFALDFVTKKGFTYMTVPHMVSSRVAMGAGFSPRGDESGNEYYVEGEDLTLIGTAEAPLTGYHADEIIDEDKLPLRYVGYSPCYRREAGTYGKHTRGLFRVHQFNKLEMYIFCVPEQSRDMHEFILATEEELWQALGVPYHVINIAAGDLGAPAAKKYDVEYWSPVDQKYRELTSCSNCTDFQARKLNIRVRRKDGKVEVLHTLNGTAVSLARSLIAADPDRTGPAGARSRDQASRVNSATFPENGTGKGESFAPCLKRSRPDSSPRSSAPPPSRRPPSTPKPAASRSSGPLAPVAVASTSGAARLMRRNWSSAATRWTSPA